MSVHHLHAYAGTLILAHLLLTLTLSALNPLGEAPDEADHWAFVVHLAHHKELPVRPRMAQSKHPPLYHATAAVAAMLGDVSNDFLRANPDVQLQSAPEWSPNFFIHTAGEEWSWRDGPRAMHLARLWSVLLSTFTVAAAYGLARAGFPGRDLLALGVVGVLAFLPEFAFIGGSINNDNAAALCGTLALWAALRLYWSGGRFRAGWWVPLALGLGLLAKVSTLMLWPVVGLAIVMGAARSELRGEVDDGNSSFRVVLHSWRRWLETSLLVFLPALLIASPWLLRNWRLFGDPLGMAYARQTIDLRVDPWSWTDSVWLLRGWFSSFWGKFGGAGHIPMADWVYVALAVVTLFSALGLARVWFVPEWKSTRPAIFLLGLACVSVAFGIWRYSLIALGTDQGRLLYPSIGALVTLFVLGIFSWSPDRHRGKATAALVSLTFLLALYALFGVISPAYAPLPSPTADELASVEDTASIYFGDLALIGWELAENPALYWRSNAVPSQDLRTVFRVTTEDGGQIWEWKRSPGRGLFSTDRWQKGTLVRDAYDVAWPDWAGPGRYRVEVGLQPYDGSLVIPIQQDIEIADTDYPFAFIGWLERR